MTKETGERRSTSETNTIKIVAVNPADLMYKNLAFAIVDPDIIARMRGTKFSPERYHNQLTEVVRVIKPLKEEGFEYLPIDGHHRTKAAEEYQRTIDPEFVYEVSDVTDQIRERENYDNQLGLTPAQYLQEIIQPTIAHKGLTSKRIAAHLLTEWPKMVGTQVAGKYTALSALALLGNPSFRDQSESKIQTYLRKNQDKPLMSDETANERSVLEYGLKEMAKTIIHTPARGYEDVMKAAFDVITSQLDINPYEAQKQVEGLLLLPQVQKKIKDASDKDTFDQHKNDLTVRIISALKNIEQVGETRALFNALIDPNLTYDHVTIILYPSTVNDIQKPLTKRYDTVKKSINVERVVQSYTESAAFDEISQAERDLLQSLCGTVIMDDKKIQRTIETVSVLHPLFTEIDAVLEQLDTTRNSEVLNKQRKILEEKKNNKPTNPRALKKAADRLRLVLNETTTALAIEKQRVSREPIVVFNDKPESVETKLINEGIAPLAYLEKLQEFTEPVSIPTAARLKDMRGELTRILDAHEAARAIPTLREASPEHKKTREIQKRTRTEKEINQATIQIDKIAQQFFPSVTDDWPKIRGLMTKRNQGEDRDATGIAAINASLTPQLLDLADQLGIDHESDEFKFLSANHYAMGITALHESEHAESEVVASYEAKMTKDMNDYIRDQRTRKYTILLQFVLYANPTNPKVKDVLTFFTECKANSYKVDEAYATYQEYLAASGDLDIQDIFNFRVLGQKRNTYKETPLDPTSPS